MLIIQLFYKETKERQKLLLKQLSGSNCHLQNSIALIVRKGMEVIIQKNIETNSQVSTISKSDLVLRATFINNEISQKTISQKMQMKGSLNYLPSAAAYLSGFTVKVTSSEFKMYILLLKLAMCKPFILTFLQLRLNIFN